MCSWLRRHACGCGPMPGAAPHGAAWPGLTPLCRAAACGDSFDMLPMLSPIMDFAIGGTPGVHTPESPDSLASGSDTVVSRPACPARRAVTGPASCALLDAPCSPTRPGALRARLASPLPAKQPSCTTCCPPAGAACLPLREQLARTCQIVVGMLRYESELVQQCHTLLPAPRPAGPPAAAGQRRQAQARCAAVSTWPLPSLAGQQPHLLAPLSEQSLAPRRAGLDALPGPCALGSGGRLPALQAGHATLVLPPRAACLNT